MDTLKTAVVVVLLLAVLYGVYVVLTEPGPLPQDLAWRDQTSDPALQIELGTPQPAADLGTIAPASSAGSALPPASTWGGAVAPGSPTTSPAVTRAELGAPSISPPELLVASDEKAAEPAASSAAVPASSYATEARNASASSPVEPSEPADQDAAVNTAAVQSASAIEQSAVNTAANLGQNRYSAAPGSERSATVDPVPAADAPEDGNTTVEVDTNTFERVMQAVRNQLAEEQWYEALLRLSARLEVQGLTSAEREQLLGLLDPLAGKVIYSTEHLIQSGYTVERGESLFAVADRHRVPWELLANINGIENPEVLLPGTQLKVVPGPFRAEVSIGRNELTLFAGKLYAGRFPITVGNDPLPQPGDYEVKDKQPGRTYYAGDGRTVASDDPSNPYGRVWIDLGGDVCIHGSSEQGITNSSGCISLSPVDATDVYGILSKGSKVTIWR